MSTDAALRPAQPATGPVTTRLDVTWTAEDEPVVLQAHADPLVPASVAGYLRDHLAGSTLVRLQALGHCPHTSAPEGTATAIRGHLLS